MNTNIYMDMCFVGTHANAPLMETLVFFKVGADRDSSATSLTERGIQSGKMKTRVGYIINSDD